MTHVKDTDDAKPSAWVEGKSFRWVGEDNNVYEVPDDDHIRTLIDDNAVTSEDPKRLSISVSDVATNPDFCVAAITMVQSDVTLNLEQISLSKPDSSAVPSDIYLKVVELDTSLSDGGTVKKTILQGNGTDKFIDVPSAKYENTSGDSQTIAIGIDNGHFETGTGSSEQLYLSFRTWKT